MKIVIDKYIDLVWQDDKPVIYVAGKKFLQCSFLAVTVSPDKLEGIDDIDQMVSFEEARTLEGVNDVDAYLHKVGNLAPEEHITPEVIMQAHASNLQAWVENDYNPGILNSDLSFPLLRELVDAGDQKARRVLESEILDRVVRGSSSSRMAMIEMSMGKYFDHDAWIAVATDKDDRVRLYVARSEHTPPDILSTLAWDESLDVRKNLVRNIHVPADVIERLSKDSSRDVRAIVAVLRSTSSAALASLASDVDFYIRSAVALNPATSRDTLVMLSNDRVFGVRMNVATNTWTPEEVLAKLAHDPIQGVRMRVVGNASAPDVVLDVLSRDDDDTVRNAAMRVIQKKRENEFWM
jgi:hypothetical protein